MSPHFFKARKRVAEPVLAGLLLQIIFAPACRMQHPEEPGKVLLLKGSDGKVFPFTRPTIDAWHLLAFCTIFFTESVISPAMMEVLGSETVRCWKRVEANSKQYEMMQCDAMAALRFCAEGNASFSLKPGEEYKFCWCLVVGRELQRIVVSRPAQMKTPHPFLKV